MHTLRARVRVGVRQGDSARSCIRMAGRTSRGLAGAGTGGDAWKEGRDGGAEGGMPRG